MGDSGTLPGRTRPSRPADLARRHAEYAEYLHSGPRRYSGHAHAIVFSGSGDGYFRLWIANVAWTVLSLGLYYPWAEVRRLRYFCRHTEVAGHALQFHGAPRKILGLGLLAVVLLLTAAGAMGHGLPAVAATALLLAAAWPALWHASLRFRLSGTGWRGLRLDFTGSLAQAYAASALPLAIALALAAGSAALWEARNGRPLAGGAATVGVVLSALLLLPYGWFRLQRHRQGHGACGPLQTELRVAPLAVYGVFARAAGLALLTLLTGLAALVGLAALFGQPASAFLHHAPAGLAAMAVLCLLVQCGPRADATRRLQNLVWSRTGNSRVRFRSDLRFTPLAALRGKNAVLLLLTFGLYWPWAAVAMARLRLEAVSLHTRVPLDELLGPAPAAAAEPAGPAELAESAARIALARLRRDAVLAYPRQALDTLPMDAHGAGRSVALATLDG